MTYLTRSMRLLLTRGLIVTLVAAGCDASNPVTVDDQGASSLDGHVHVFADVRADQTTSTDAAPEMSTTRDAQLFSDAEIGFPQLLEGVWLVGWQGGVNRFSWIRFSMTSAMGGEAEINAGTLLGGGTVPYWNCSGAASWSATAKPNTLQLHYPSAECTGMRSETFTFTNIASTEGYPMGALLVATIEPLTTSPSVISGYKFPPDQCTADLSSCTDPL